MMLNRSPILPLVHQRAIEARMAVAMIEGFAEAVGRRPALETAGRVIRGLAREFGRHLAAERGSNTLADLADLVFQIWCAEDALTIDILEHTPSRFYFHVVRCGYAEQYDQMGLEDYGFCLSCNRDGAFCEGFNPAIRLTRTQTIMEGAPFCDFRFKLIPPTS